MFKNLLLLILAMKLPLTLAGSNPYLMTHESFVHLTDEQQKQLVIETMKMVVEMESQIPNDTESEIKISQHNEFVRKYSRALERLSAMVLDSAWAAKNPSQDWEEYAKDFTDSFSSDVRETEATVAPVAPEKPDLAGMNPKTKREAQKKYNSDLKAYKKEKAAFDRKRNAQILAVNKCYFGGWPSKIRYTAKDIKAIKSKYKNQEPTPGQVGTELQVEFQGGQVCPRPMQLSTKDKEYQDYKAAMGSCNPANQMTCNPAIFGFKSSSEKSLFCVDSPKGETQNTAYLCMREALSDSQEGGRDSRETRLNFLRDRMAANPAYTDSVFKFVMRSCTCNKFSLKEKLDAGYMAKVRPERTCYGMLTMVKEAMTGCSVDVSETVPMMESFQKYFQANLTADANVSEEELANLGKDKARWKNVDEKLSSIDKVYKGFLESIKENSAVQASCKVPEPKPPVPVKLPPPPQPEACQVEKDNCTKADGETYTCKATTKIGAETIELDPVVGKVGDEVSAKKGETSYPIKCKIPVMPKPDPVLVCNLTVTPGEKFDTYTGTAVLVDADKLQDYKLQSANWVEPSDKAVSEPVAWNGSAITAKAICKIEKLTEKKIIEVSAEGKLAERPKKEGVTFEVVPEGESPTEQKAKATLTPVEKDGPTKGYQIAWFTTGKPKKEKKGPIIAGDSNQEKTEEAVDDDVAGPKEFSSEDIQKVPRLKEKYKLCARLIKDGKTVEPKKCVSVPEIKEEAKPGPAPTKKAPIKVDPKNPFQAPALINLPPRPGYILEGIR